jgi:hypothetical protein
VGDELRRAGEEVIVPDLVAAATSGDPRRFVTEAASAVRAGDDEVVIVGHSGAGALLPLIAAGLPAQPRLLVFVDAGVPPCEGTATLGGEFLDTLRALATEDRLPPWSQWWDDRAMERLVHRDERRTAIEAELPAVPLSFYEARITVPPDWCETNAAYVLLSPAYRDDALTASGRGWPVVEQLGGHLDIANDERSIASILRALTAPSTLG